MKPESTLLALNTYTKLMRAAESVTGRVGKHMAAAKLTISQFGVLEALLHKGPLCQKDIAAKILKSNGNITMVIDNLEKQGLVRRERATDDRRYFNVLLTDPGKALIEEVYLKVEEAIVAEMGGISTTEQKVLGDLCKRLGLR